MIQSMTGFGSAEHAEKDVGFTLEVRSVNNRYLKLSIKLPEPYQFLEPSIDRTLKSRLSRGSLSCVLTVRRVTPEVVPIDVGALERYVAALGSVRTPPGIQATVDLGALSQLPGVWSDSVALESRDRDERIVAGLMERALNSLVAMRRDEGAAIQSDLLECIRSVRDELKRIQLRAPLVIDEYHERLGSRVRRLLEAGTVELEADSLAREVAVFAERCDISEEINRLGSHLDQFVQLFDRDEPVGRTLDFLAQELLREANTIASKGNDAEIARSVVEIKGKIDRMKEQIQNVE